MRAIFFVFAVLLSAGCEVDHHSNFYDLGNSFKHIGEPCTADVPPNSVCGYTPQFYCSKGGVCASACNADADCTDGSVCVGAADMGAGECRLPSSPDAG